MFRFVKRSETKRAGSNKKDLTRGEIFSTLIAIKLQLPYDPFDYAPWPASYESQGRQGHPECLDIARHGSRHGELSRTTNDE